MSLYKHPGCGSYFVECVICGKKIRFKDARITYGTLGTKIVCQEDYEDPHPQDYNYGRKESAPPKWISPERPARYAAITTSGDGPGIPTDIYLSIDLNNYVYITWSMLNASLGSSNVTGFKIERESPVGDGFTTLVANTNSPALAYLDKTVLASTEYNYRITAINGHGTGSASDAAAITTAS